MLDIEEKWISTDQTVELIRNAIESKSPLSLVRIQDGELRLINNPVGRTTMAELEQILWVHFGRWPLADRHVNFISQSIIDSARNADILGLFRGPLVQHPNVSEYEKLLFSAVWHQMVAPQARVVNADIHNDLLLADAYRSLLTGLPYLGLVTCRDIAGGVSHHYRIPRVETFVIPEQGQFVTNQDAFYQSRPHFPDVFFEMERRLVPPYQGAVFLVGAGLLGKRYCDIIKSRGGIAIDVGSVFDVWYGILTRAQYGNREASETHEKYRLVDRRQSLPQVTEAAKVWSLRADVGKVNFEASSQGPADIESVGEGRGVYMGPAFSTTSQIPYSDWNGRNEAAKSHPEGMTFIEASPADLPSLAKVPRAAWLPADGGVLVDNTVSTDDLKVGAKVQPSGIVYADRYCSAALKGRAVPAAEMGHFLSKVDVDAENFWALCEYTVMHPMRSHDWGTALSMQVGVDGEIIFLRSGIGNITQVGAIYTGDNAASFAKYDFEIGTRVRAILCFAGGRITGAINGYVFQPSNVPHRKASVRSVRLGAHINGAHPLGGLIHKCAFGEGTISVTDLEKLTSA